MSDYLMQFLIEYITKCFKEDADFSNVNFNVVEAYDYNVDLDCPQIAIQFLDNTENEQYSTFISEEVSDFGIQFNIYAENMEINDIVYTAKKCSTMIAEKLKIFINDIKFKRLNTNIVRLLRVGYDYRVPLDNTGQVYTNVIRYDCQIIYPYNKNLENINKGE